MGIYNMCRKSCSFTNYDSHTRVRSRSSRPSNHFSIIFFPYSSVCSLTFMLISIPFNKLLIWFFGRTCFYNLELIGFGSVRSRFGLIWFRVVRMTIEYHLQIPSMHNFICLIEKVNRMNNEDVEKTKVILPLPLATHTRTKINKGIAFNYPFVAAWINILRVFIRCCWFVKKSLAGGGGRYCCFSYGISMDLMSWRCLTSRGYSP